MKAVRYAIERESGESAVKSRVALRRPPVEEQRLPIPLRDKWSKGRRALSTAIGKLIP
jgi:hypothetical protein